MKQARAGQALDPHMYLNYQTKRGARPRTPPKTKNWPATAPATQSGRASRPRPSGRQKKKKKMVGGGRAESRQTNPATPRRRGFAAPHRARDRTAAGSWGEIEPTTRTGGGAGAGGSGGCRTASESSGVHPVRGSGLGGGGTRRASVPTSMEPGRGGCAIRVHQPRAVRQPATGRRGGNSRARPSGRRRRRPRAATTARCSAARKNRKRPPPRPGRGARPSDLAPPAMTQPFWWWSRPFGCAPGGAPRRQEPRGRGGRVAGGRAGVGGGWGGRGSRGKGGDWHAGRGGGGEWGRRG